MDSGAHSISTGQAVATPSLPSGNSLFRGYIGELDGVRAYGILIVCTVHLWPGENYHHQLFLALQTGWIMMDAFFVLSGFLITGILLDSRHRSDYYRSFYGRRALRILPVYYAVLILITAVARFHGHAIYQDMLAHWGSPWWFFAYIGNIPTAITGLWPLAGGKSFVPLWSLQIEEQFYLLFPLLVRRLSLPLLKRILVAACCVSTALRLILYWLYPTNELVQYVLLPCRLEGLAMGAWIAIRFREGAWTVNKRKLSAVVIAGGVATFAFAVWAGYDHTQPLNRTVGFLISPTWCALLTLWMIQFRSTKWTAWLRFPALNYLGRVSYAAYLIHLPVFNALLAAGDRYHLAWLQPSYSLLAIALVATFAVSSLSWQFFEKPVLGLKDRLFPSPARSLPAESVA